MTPKDLASVSLKIVSRKRRRECTKSKDRFTTVLVRIYDLRVSTITLNFAITFDRKS
jgi:transcriptional regulator NrdR family protein